MEIFRLHEDVIRDYESYVSSFINIADDDIRGQVGGAMAGGSLWPEPLLQFNPDFEVFGTTDELVQAGVLQPQLTDVFHGYRLYDHQVRAIELGSAQKHFVVTSGTGSGKSLTYIGSIFNYLLRQDSKPPGITAVIVYPMNALINSQFDALNAYAATYKERTGNDLPISFAKYTSQEDDAIRRDIKSSPPDILLTNYMMLELILSRVDDMDVKNSIYANLRFLVFDELHTYRGRQGSDIAMLIRRIRTSCDQSVTCMGTSATMVAGGTVLEQKERVADAAGKLFGVSLTADQIIQEKLRPSLSGSMPTRDSLQKAVSSHLPQCDDVAAVLDLPTLAWIEGAAALKRVDNDLVRQPPLTLTEISSRLSDASGCSVDECRSHVIHLLQSLDRVNALQTAAGGKTYLPFKLHQFVSQTGVVHTTLEPVAQRQVVLNPEAPTAPDADGSQIPLFPTVFSRKSGASFVCVRRNIAQSKFEPRDFDDYIQTDDDDEDAPETYDDGYLIFDVECWNADEDLEQLPEAWLRRGKDGSIRGIIKKYADRMPRLVHVDRLGHFSTTQELAGTAWYMPVRLLFDPTAGVFYDLRTREFSKLTPLGSEGRSTSTTIATFSILRQMAAGGMSVKEQKLLSFTDNRQDAALQAGHFNDFINVAQIRSAIHAALEATPGRQLDYTTLGDAILAALDLPFVRYANYSGDGKQRFKKVQDRYSACLKKYITYRALYDLRYGWRVILPNLEQCALLQIGYADLDEFAGDGAAWESVPFVGVVSPEKRKEILHAVLDYCRLSYALYSENFLSEDAITTSEMEIRELLISPWRFEEKERIQRPNHLRIGVLSPFSRLHTQSAGPTSRIGRYLKREASAHFGRAVNNAEYIEIMQALLDALTDADLLYRSSAKGKDGDDVALYQLRVSEIQWRLGDGETVHVPAAHSASYKDTTTRPNQFFQDLYRTSFGSLKPLVGAEHTGQLNNPDRIQREGQFSEGQISALYCSPTMELGVDIGDLSIVHMRNVPPTPANYAQRSGRAGRSGQAALVFTYCSSRGPHDSHYFRHRRDMVAGAVAPPLLDLCNRELLITHLNALYISKYGLPHLEHSLESLLDMETDEALELKKGVTSHIHPTAERVATVSAQFKNVIGDFAVQLAKHRAPWFSDEWIDRQLAQIAAQLDDSMNRWRSMYKDAMRLLNESTDKIKSGLYSPKSKEFRQANANMHQAAQQIALLRNDQSKSHQRKSNAEFYPWRYLAAEGFFPGYNFTRLPVSVYVQESETDGDYISRARTVGIREFGPENLVYHKGRKHKITQMVVSDAENALVEAKVCKGSGYFLMGEKAQTDHCPFSGRNIENAADVESFAHLIELGAARTVMQERITCEEEERRSKGYEIATFFSIDGDPQRDREQTRLVNDGRHFMNMAYIPCARLFLINKRWRARKEMGFKMGLTSGQWKTERMMQDRTEDSETVRAVQLYTSDTADALYLEPVEALGLDEAGVITLQYALKKAIEIEFQIESSEIGVTAMGGTSIPNIFLYEASEGSLGVLSQFVTDKDVWPRIVDRAIAICHYDDDDARPATYADLLSYYNQRDHQKIDRFSIRDALNKLRACAPELTTCKDYSDYDAQFAAMLEAMDPTSATERKFLEYLHAHDLRLPDAAQRPVSGVYAQPDFYYEKNIHVFCDGTPHDTPKVKEDDHGKREQIRSLGHEVLTYHYKDDLDEWVARRPDIFFKVR
jgi:superfamily II DNA/RNA helicase